MVRFSIKVVGVQLSGISACFIWIFITSFIIFKLISITIGLRVSAQDEAEGLDFTEHSGNAYPDSETSTYKKKYIKNFHVFDNRTT